MLRIPSASAREEIKNEEQEDVIRNLELEIFNSHSRAMDRQPGYEQLKLQVEHMKAQVEQAQAAKQKMEQDAEEVLAEQA